MSSIYALPNDFEDHGLSGGVFWTSHQRTFCLNRKFEEGQQKVGAYLVRHDIYSAPSAVAFVFVHLAQNKFLPSQVSSVFS